MAYTGGMSELSPDAIVDLFKDMTLSEVTEFRKMFEETFGVTAEVPAAVVVPIVVEELVEEQTEFDVILEAAGDKKIQVIKVVREITRLGLKEAKDMVDKAPQVVAEGTTKEHSEEIRGKLAAVGATITIK